MLTHLHTESVWDCDDLTLKSTNPGCGNLLTGSLPVLGPPRGLPLGEIVPSVGGGHVHFISLF